MKRHRSADTFDPKVVLATTAFSEIIQMVIILLVARPYPEALALVKIIAFPMIATSSVGAALFMSIIGDRKNMYEKAAAIFSTRAFKIAERTLGILTKGFNRQKAPGNLLPDHLLQLGKGFIGHLEGVLRTGECPVLDLFSIGADGLYDDGPDLGVLFDELGDKFIKEADHVVGDQHLAVHIRTRADSDDGHAHRFGHEFAQARRHRLQDDGKGPGIL